MEGAALIPIESFDKETRTFLLALANNGLSIQASHVLTHGNYTEVTVRLIQPAPLASKGANRWPCKPVHQNTLGSGYWKPAKKKSANQLERDRLRRERWIASRSYEKCKPLEKAVTSTPGTPSTNPANESPVLQPAPTQILQQNSESDEINSSDWCEDDSPFI